MTYIPNVRSKKDELSAMYGKDRDNGYWEGYLDADGKRDLAMYDFVIDNVVDCWFSNIGCFNGVEVGKKKLKALREDMLDWCESHRNELVVSMLDEQACREEAANGD